MNTLDALEESRSGLSSELALAVQAQKLSARTVQTYRHWITQYLSYFNFKNPRYLTVDNVKEFLAYLFKSLSLSRAKMNQAREALVFLYDKVLHKPAVAERL